jgi:hypothetical protein
MDMTKRAMLGASGRAARLVDRFTLAYTGSSDASDIEKGYGGVAVIDMMLINRLGTVLK